MRIIAGEFRSRLLVTPADNETTRPIPDRVKESLFAILRGHTEDAIVFDAFAGTGAVGLEALSRGAARCVFVEKDKRIAAILQKNIDNLRVGDRTELVIGDALGPGALARCPRGVNLIFFDPPYPLVREPIGFKRVAAQFAQLVARLDPAGYAVLRTPWPFFLEVPDAEEQPAEPERPKKDRRAKERDRAMRDPARAARYEDLARRSPIPPATEPIPAPAHDEELDEADLGDLASHADAGPGQDPDRELTEAEIAEMMGLPDARPLGDLLSEALLSGSSQDDRHNADLNEDELNEEELEGDPDADDTLDADDALDTDEVLDIEDQADFDESHPDDEPHARPARSKPRDKRGDEPDIHITPPRPKTHRLDTTLAIPGARGPETHIYGSMAVHIYMRA